MTQGYGLVKTIYHQTSDISCSKSQNLNVTQSRFAVVFAQTIEARCSDENEDVVGAAPTADRQCSNYIWMINNFIA